MPFLDGYDATVQIRKYLWEERGLQLRQQPIISAVTAHTEEIFIQKCYESGMNYVLSKPVKIDKMKQICEEAGVLS